MTLAELDAWCERLQSRDPNAEPFDAIAADLARGKRSTVIEATRGGFVRHRQSGPIREVHR